MTAIERMRARRARQIARKRSNQGVKSRVRARVFALLGHKFVAGGATCLDSERAYRVKVMIWQALRRAGITGASNRRPRR